MSAADRNGFKVIPTAYRQVLLSALQANRNRSSLWFLALVGLPVLVSVLGSSWWFIRKLPFTVSISATTIALTAMPFAAIVLVAAWAMLVFNVLLQNHPHTARLLPAQVPVLRNTLLGTAALLCAVSTLLSWLAGGPVLATAAGMALGLALLAVALRLAWVGVLIAALGFSLPLLSVGGHLEPVLSVWRTAPEVLTVLTLVLASLALRAVVMTGDARHERAHARLKLMSAAMRGQVSGTSAQPLGPPGWTWVLKLGNNGYAKWMERVLAQVHPTLGARLALGLGPQAHWSSVVSGQCLALTLIALALLALQLFSPNWGLVPNTFGALMIGNLAGGLTVTVRLLPTALWANRREQSLLRLLPGSPQGAPLNRWLAARLASVHLAILVMQGLGMFVMSNLVDSDATAGQAVEMAVSALILSLPLAFTLWRDWASAEAPGGFEQVLVALAMVAILGLAAVWVHLLHRTWYELAALTLLLTLPLGWWRWRVISRVPTAWPVGRLG